MATTVRTGVADGGDGKGWWQVGQGGVSRGKLEPTHELASHEVYDDFATLGMYPPPHMTCILLLLI